MAQIKVGNVGVITLEDKGPMYRVTYVGDDYLWCEPISGGAVTVVSPLYFWALLDSFAP